jgi:serine/threonine protein kinase
MPRPREETSARRARSSLFSYNLRISPAVQTDFCILVQDYAVNGDLYSYLHKNRIRLTEARLVQLVLHPCLSALAYLHSHNIIHRDIKPENLLLAEGDVIKLADFGLSVNTEEENPVTRAGTLDYMAPEVLVCPLKRLPSDHKEKVELAYTTKVDSWSMGVLAYELLAGRPPFSHRDETDLLQVCFSLRHHCSHCFSKPFNAALCLICGVHWLRIRRHT